MTIERQPPECWLTDMDGVLVHEEHALPGAAEFIARLIERDRRFLVLTNNSIFTPRDLAARLSRAGLTVPESAIWTSALATADFLHSQKPGGSAYVIGEAGLTTAMHEVGYTLTDHDADYVVIGEARNLSFASIARACRSRRACRTRRAARLGRLHRGQRRFVERQRRLDALDRRLDIAASRSMPIQRRPSAWPQRRSCRCRRTDRAPRRPAWCRRAGCGRSAPRASGSGWTFTPSA
jgi:hypothetical protein